MRKPIYSALIILLAVISYCCSPTPSESNSLKIKSNQQQSDIKKLYQSYSDLLYQNYDSSRVVLQHLLTSLSQLPKDQRTVATSYYSNLSTQENRKNNRKLSDSLQNLAFEYAKLYNDSSIYALLYLNQGSILRYRAKFTKAKINYTKAIELAKKYKDSSVLIPAIADNSSMLINSQNSNQQLERMKAALSLFKQNKFLQNKADLYANLGVLYERRNNLYLAMDYYKKSISILDQIHSRKNYLSPMHNLANIYGELGNDSLALVYYQKVLNLAKSQKNNRLTATTLINLGNFYIGRHQLDSAAYYENKALKVLNSFHGAYLKAIVYLDLGIIEKEKNNFTSSAHFLTKSFKIAKKWKMKSYINEINYHRADLNFQQKKYNNVVELVHSVYNYARNNHNLSLLTESSLLLARASYALHKNDTALRYFDLHEQHQKQYNDTLLAHKNRNFAYQYELEQKNFENKQLALQQKIQQKQIQTDKATINQQRILILFIITVIGFLVMIVSFFIYRSRLRTRTLQLLRSKNGEIRLKNAELEDENDFKNKLFSIITHDVKSPLISLHNFLNLLDMDEIARGEKETLLKETMAKNENTLNMVEDLLIWTRKQLDKSSITIVRLNFCEILDEVLNLYYRMADNKQIKIVIDCQNEFWIYSDPSILKMLIRNLVSNAIKYTPENGNITIGIHKNRESFTFYVKDSGLGIPDKYKDKLLNSNEYFTTLGSNREKGHGIGLKLCKYFVEKNQGKIWFESEPKQGTCFFVSFPNTNDSKQD